MLIGEIGMAIRAIRRADGVMIMGRTCARGRCGRWALGAGLSSLYRGAGWWLTNAKRTPRFNAGGGVRNAARVVSLLHSIHNQG